MRRTAVLVGWMGFLGVILFLALTVYPFDLDPVNGALLSGGLILLLNVRTALDNATI